MDVNLFDLTVSSEQQGIVQMEKIIEIHPSFRVVSLGSLTKEAHFTEDTMTMFSCLSLLPPSKDCMRGYYQVVKSRVSRFHCG